MAEIKIRLIFNKETGKKDIFIDYESESDALPIEHENEHRDIVKQLLGKGVLSPDEVGDIEISRTGNTDSTPQSQSQEQSAPEQQAQGN